LNLFRFHPLQNMPPHAHQLALLVVDFNFRCTAPLFRLNLFNDIIDRKGIPDKHRLDESNAVITGGDRRLIDAACHGFFDDQRRGRRHKADEQRAVNNAPAER